VSIQQLREVVETEAEKEDNLYMDAFVVVVYGTPDGFSMDYFPQALATRNLQGVPKLVYVISK